MVITVFSINNQLVFTSIHQEINRGFSIISKITSSPQNEQDFMLSLVNKSREEMSYIITHNFLVIWL